MPRQFIEKGAIVDQAYELAEEKGLAAVNIRDVAKVCGVSVGSIYNYFPSKDDLVVAVIDKFFGKAFFTDFCNPEPDENFVAYCRRLYAGMRETLSRFRSDWLVQVQSMGSGMRQAGKQREAERLLHMQHGLEHVLENDTRIRPDALTGALSAEAICAFAVHSMMDALRTGTDDCRVLFALLERTLY